MREFDPRRAHSLPFLSPYSSPVRSVTFQVISMSSNLIGDNPLFKIRPKVRIKEEPPTLRNNRKTKTKRKDQKVRASPEGKTRRKTRGGNHEEGNHVETTQYSGQNQDQRTTTRGDLVMTTRRGITWRRPPEGGRSKRQPPEEEIQGMTTGGGGRS